MQFAAMLISTFWVNRRCESIIKSNRFHVHNIKSLTRAMSGRAHTFEIAPKEKKVLDQMMDIIERKRTFTVELDPIAPMNRINSERDDITEPQSSPSSPSGPDRPSGSNAPTLKSLSSRSIGGMSIESPGVSSESLKKSPTSASLKKSRSWSGRRSKIKRRSVSVSGSSRLSTVEIDSQESLQSILADDVLLDLFAKHLVKELCMECLLSLIEMQQFKSYMKEQLDVGDFVEWQIVELAPNVV